MAVPPTGTVTFLFTDIEGSTRMWERDPSAMQPALGRHDEILWQAIEANDGYVFKTVGDAFCAAFGTATDALEAALAGQRALRQEPWEEACEIRARMALHTGAAEERSGDYFGPTVNRVARLLSAGHGGQTLLSLATQELVRDGLPDGRELRDMGDRRLKDLTRPERVFQLITPDLPSDFPALKTLDARLNNLPAQPTPLVGRGREVAEVCGLLRQTESRLLTLTGPGGTGKTRLALQAAAELLDEFEGGVFFVALAPVRDPALVASAIAGHLGVKEGGGQPLTEVLKAYLRDKELLLVLDNFEQLLDAAPLVGELLAFCPRLKVLVTSRATLDVYGEREYAVPPLALPDIKRLPSIERLAQYEAVRLFIGRARAAKAGFEVTSENAPAVAEICVRLDGLPLAIELAAARSKILSPEAMLERLGNRLKLLRGGARDLPDRQRTLRGAIDWSHDLLEEDERALFRRLSVFTGGFILSASEEVCGAGAELNHLDAMDVMDVMDTVESLLGKSLLRAEVETGQGPRFHMLETIKEYARERLAEAAEAETVRMAHAQYFLALAEEAEPGLKGREQGKWLERLEADHDNLRAALSWSLGGGDPGLGLRLGGALYWFWLLQGHHGEGGGWLEEALAKNSWASASARAKAMNAAATLAMEQGDLARAQTLSEDAVSLYREAKDEAGVAIAALASGSAAVYTDLGRAAALMEESLALHRGLADGWGIGLAVAGLGTVEVHRGNYERAITLFEESLVLFRESEDKLLTAVNLVNLGYATLLHGDYGRSAAYSEEGLALSRTSESRGLVVGALVNLGWATLLQGDLGRAMAVLDEALTMSREMGNKAVAAECLEGLAGAAASCREAPRAARLFGASEALRAATGMPLTPDESALREPFVRAARSRLDEAAWREAWAKGRSLAYDEAVSYALAGAGESGQTREAELAWPER